MAFEVEQIEDWKGQEVVDPDGEKIGKLEEIFLEVDSDDAGIGSVKTGLLGRKHSLVPLEGATFTPDAVRVTVTKDQVKDAPTADPEDPVTGKQESEMLSHYRLPPSGASAKERDGVRFETASARGERSAEAERLREEASRQDRTAKAQSSAAENANEQVELARGERQESTGKADEAARRAQELREEADRHEQR